MIQNNDSIIFAELFKTKMSKDWDIGVLTFNFLIAHLGMYIYIYNAFITSFLTGTYDWNGLHDEQ